MAEQTQIQQATMKDPKKVKAGKKLAEYNHRKREELTQMKTQKSEANLLQDWSLSSHWAFRRYRLIRLPIKDS